MKEINKEIELVKHKLSQIKGSGMSPEESAVQHNHLSQVLSDLLQVRDVMKINS